MNVKISALVGDKYYLLSEGLVDLAKEFKMRLLAEKLSSSGFDFKLNLVKNEEDTYGVHPNSHISL